MRSRSSVLHWVALQTEARCSRTSFLSGVPYIQRVKDVTDPTMPVGLHFGPGLWMLLPATSHPLETKARNHKRDPHSKMSDDLLMSRA